MGGPNGTVPLKTSFLARPPSSARWECNEMRALCFPTKRWWFYGSTRRVGRGYRIFDPLLSQSEPFCVIIWQSAKDHITTSRLYDLRLHDFHDFTTFNRSRNSFLHYKSGF